MVPSVLRVHGAEAEAAALSEMWENARHETEAVLKATRPRWRSNAATLALPRAAEDRAGEREEAYQAEHEGAQERAYGSADASLAHREILRYNGNDFAGTPAEWFGETRRALCRSMREAHEEGLPTLLDGLEPLREWATVQEILAVRREVSGTPA